MTTSARFALSCTVVVLLGGALAWWRPEARLFITLLGAVWVFCLPIWWWASAQPPGRRYGLLGGSLALAALLAASATPFVLGTWRDQLWEQPATEPSPWPLRALRWTGAADDSLERAWRDQRWRAFLESGPGAAPLRAAALRAPEDLPADAQDLLLAALLDLGDEDLAAPLAARRLRAAEAENTPRPQLARWLAERERQREPGALGVIVARETERWLAWEDALLREDSAAAWTHLAWLGELALATGEAEHLATTAALLSRGLALLRAERYPAEITSLIFLMAEPERMSLWREIDVALVLPLLEMLLDHGDSAGMERLLWTRARPNDEALLAPYRAGLASANNAASATLVLEGDGWDGCTLTDGVHAWPAPLPPQISLRPGHHHLQALCGEEVFSRRTFFTPERPITWRRE